jgi:hypothetical protein
MDPKRQPDDVSSYIVDGWKNYVPVLPAFGPGRQEFRLVYEDGRLMKSVELEAEPSTGPALVQSSQITMHETAKLMRRSYFWLVKNWKKIGLHRSAFGRPYVFERAEVDSFLRSRRFCYRGRPKKGSKGAV